MEPEYDTKDATVYLSFDIGIRNFAYCLVSIEGQNVNLLQWENIDILEENGVMVTSSKKIPMHKIRPLLVKTLEKRRSAWSRVDRILMEQQIGHSRNAKFEGMVCMWLHLQLQKPIQTVSPRQKLMVHFVNNLWTKDKNVDAQAYKLRKEYTVNLVTSWVQTQDPTLRATFMDAAKKDDLADVLVQAIAVHIKEKKKK